MSGTTLGIDFDSTGQMVINDSTALDNALANNSADVVADSAACTRLFDRPRILSSEVLPPDFLSLLSREYGADAVMFVDITSLSTYQPLIIGLRTKLASANGTILWAFDTLFSASDPAVSNSARCHDRKRYFATNPGDMSYTVLRSPMRFADYAAATAFATLPPR